MDMFDSWSSLTAFLSTSYSIEPDLLSVLFLIGIQESGKGFRDYDQDEKTDLVKLGKFTLLSRAGFYKRMEVPGKEPFFIPLPDKEPPSLPEELDRFLKEECLRYFNEHLAL